MSRLALLEAPRKAFERISALPPSVLLTAALGVFMCLTVPPLWGDTETADENMHLWAGYRHLTAADYTENPWHPPLAKMLIAIPLRLIGVRPPGDLKPYDDVPPWSHGFAFLHRSGNDPVEMLACARSVTVAWGMLLIVLSYFASRSLFGREGALITLTLTTFCPTLLAHAHLATNDVPAATMLLACLMSFRRLITRPSAWAGIATGVALGIAWGVKHSLLMLLPVFAFLGAVTAFRRRARPQGRPEDRWIELRAVSLAGTVLVTAWIVLWASYRFTFRPTSEPAAAMAWWFELTGVQGACIRFARDHSLLPESYLYGLGFLQDYAARGHPAYALGRYSLTGWSWYFPFAFLVKTPVPSVALFGLGLLGSIRRAVRRASLDDLLFSFTAVVYGALAVNSTLNLGIRHLLPVLPLLAVLAGGVDPRNWGERLGKAAPAGIPVLLLGLAAGVLAEAPHFIAYFNFPSCLVFERRSMLADSNLDWGQDLGRLKRYMDRNGIATVKLAYFGNASPRDLGLRHERLPGFNLYSRYEPEWKPASDFKPGDWVAISATCYTGALSEDRGFYLERFGRLTPVAEIGHSILVYQVPAEGLKFRGAPPR